MKRLFLLSFLFCQTSFSSYKEILDTSELTIDTPSMRSRKSRKILLENGLKAYIISDPDIEKSACAVGVNVGSWQDPEEYQGLAHLVEHMLFLGTKKFPESDGFSKFLSNNGGKSNAFTASDRTVYMFSSDHKAFDEALERFCDFFCDPNLDPKLISSELVNVDQEHEKNVGNDFRRSYMVFKEIGNKDHPNSKFSTGNRQTLGNVPEETLRDWFSNYYSSEHMHLVVYSAEPLDTLTEKVAKEFSNIPVRAYKKPSYPKNLLPSSKSTYMTYIDPVKDLDILSAMWQMPEKFLSDPAQSLDLIAYALSRGQKNSLEELLKKKGWIEEMHIYTENIGNEAPFFFVDFSLTQKGLQNKEKVLELFFSAIAGLKKTQIPFYLFREKNEMAHLAYRYQTRESAFAFVRKHADNLFKEDLASYPKNTLIAEKYDAKNILEALNALSPEKGHYSCLSSSKNFPFPYEKKEKWMSVSYTQKALSSELVKTWQDISPNSSIKVPPQNPYIPKNLSIYPLVKKLETPHLLIDHEKGRLYSLQDQEFLSPEVVHLFHIKSPILTKSAVSSTKAYLFLQIMRQKLQPILLSARAAGLEVSIGYSKGALHLAFLGYSEKAPLLIEESFKLLKKAPVQEEDYESAKTSLIKVWENAQFNLPAKQGLQLLQSFLEEGVQTEEELAKELKNVSYKDFLAFRENLFEKTYIEGFLSGNLTVKQVESIWLDITTLLESKPYPKASHLIYSSLALPQDTKPFCIERSAPVNGTGVVLTIDQGLFSYETRAHQLILSKALHQEFFHTLRTKQKTAYIARSSALEKKGHLFQTFFVQSSSHSSFDLLYRFELFLEKFLQEFPEIFPKDRFEKIQKSIESELRSPFRNLEEKTDYYDRMAFKESGNFEKIDHLLQAVQNLQYEDFAKFSHHCLSRKNTKRLAIFINGVLSDTFSYDVLSSDSWKKLQNESKS